MDGEALALGRLKLQYFKVNGELLELQHNIFLATTTDAVTTTKATLSSAFQVTLDEHNKYRRLHCDTPDLEFDAEVSAVAQTIADKMEVWGHSERSERNGYGENLAWNMESTIEKAIEKAMQGFYKEIEHYDWNSPGWSTKVGHFTQV